MSFVGSTWSSADMSAAYANLRSSKFTSFNIERYNGPIMEQIMKALLRDSTDQALVPGACFELRCPPTTLSQTDELTRNAASWKPVTSATTSLGDPSRLVPPILAPFKGLGTKYDKVKLQFDLLRILISYLDKTLAVMNPWSFPHTDVVVHSARDTSLTILLEPTACSESRDLPVKGALDGNRAWPGLKEGLQDTVLIPLSLREIARNLDDLYHMTGGPHGWLFIEARTYKYCKVGFVNKRSDGTEYHLRFYKGYMDDTDDLEVPLDERALQPVTPSIEPHLHREDTHASFQEEPLLKRQGEQSRMGPHWEGSYRADVYTKATTASGRQWIPDHFIAFDLEHMLEKFLQRIEQYPPTFKAVVSSADLKFKVKYRLLPENPSARYCSIYVGKVAMPAQNRGVHTAWLNPKAAEDNYHNRKGIHGFLITSITGQRRDVSLADVPSHFRRAKYFSGFICSVKRQEDSVDDAGNVWAVGLVTYDKPKLG